MRISGTADLAAPPAKVFEALNDPAVLAATHLAWGSGFLVGRR